MKSVWYVDSMNTEMLWSASGAMTDLAILVTPIGWELEAFPPPDTTFRANHVASATLMCSDWGSSEDGHTLRWLRTRTVWIQVSVSWCLLHTVVFISSSRRLTCHTSCSDSHRVWARHWDADGKEAVTLCWAASHLCSYDFCSTSCLSSLHLYSKY